MKSEYSINKIIIDGSYLLPKLLLKVTCSCTTSVCLSHSVKDRLSLSAYPFVPESECKGTPNFWICKHITRKICRKYPIFLVTFEQLDTGFYADLAAKHGVTLQKKLFDASLFANIDGYNRLTKDVNFYKAFSDFEFFLIYQPDAWVFSDQLEYWCSQNYDYIGAPWIPGGGEIDLSPYDGYKFVKSGNGGFSLRKTEYFVRLLSAKGAVYTKDGVARKIENLKKQEVNLCHKSYS